MATPEHHSNHSQYSGHEHHRVNHMDQPSPMNMLWGLILALLTFLLVVICVLSINWIADLSNPDTDDEQPPSTDTTPVEPPLMLPSAIQPIWTPETPEATITFTSDAAFADFSHVTVDGSTVDPSCYVVSEGSTVVTLRAEYLATLNAGTYQIGIHSANGVATATFEIKAAPEFDPGPGGNDTSGTPSFIMHKDANTVQLNRKQLSTDIGVYTNYAIVVDLSTNRIVAELNMNASISPASMTKVMTLLVACEALAEIGWNDYVMISADVINEMVAVGASLARDPATHELQYRAGMELQIKDLLYGVAVESDCALSVELARYIAGSEAAFVEMMNAKCEELGLMYTNFENASGLHHPNHYTTVREMASIMAAAMANEQVKMLLSTKMYNSSNGGVFRSTYFCDVVEDIRGFTQVNPSHGEIIAAKTGKTDEAGSCLATYMETSADQHGYVVITAGGVSQLTNVKDHVALYEDYCKK